MKAKTGKVPGHAAAEGNDHGGAIQPRTCGGRTEHLQRGQRLGFLARRDDRPLDTVSGSLERIGTGIAVQGIDVRIADLDLVNPYFRTREARGSLSELGIEVVLPPEQYLQADLPILSPEVAGLIRQPSQLTLLDVGGDDVGATVLATLEDDLKGKSLRVLQVINPLRPFTETHEGCLKIRDAIETASKLTVNGLIGNANLIDGTAPEDNRRFH